ncbi:MAG: hypothetical protein MI757_17595, partial [Pirellulales bacterium]|nr:hypothetical protein [Pirellulales bacterium]
YQAVLWTTDYPTGPKCVADYWPEDLKPSLLPNDREESVLDVGRERHRKMGFAEGPDPMSMPDLRQGRLLLFFPDATLFDGAAEAETGGFFNVQNAPAWDTWVAYFEDSRTNDSYSNYLVAYIPGALLQTVEFGIVVNPEESIAWLENTDTFLAKRLKDTGVIT